MNFSFLFLVGEVKNLGQIPLLSRPMTKHPLALMRTWLICFGCIVSYCLTSSCDWLESLVLVSTVDNSFHTINLLQRNPFQSYILIRFRLTQTDRMYPESKTHCQRSSCSTLLWHIPSVFKLLN